MMWQTNMTTSFSKDKQRYSLFFRSGTKGLKPKPAAGAGPFTCTVFTYEALPKLERGLGAADKDDFTDGASYSNWSLALVSPGRGEV